MAEKSETQKILLGMCPPESRVSYPYTAKLSADVVLIDGFIFLYSKGNDLCTLRIRKWHPNHTKAAPQANPDGTIPFHLLQQMFDSHGSSNIGVHPAECKNKKTTHRTEEGKWRDLGVAFEKILRKAFMISGAKCVTLLFDKREHISKAKSIAQCRRAAARKKERERQKEKDQKDGIEPTQGIPFTFDSISPDQNLPYPWSEVAGNKDLLAIVVQYILVYHIIPKIDSILKNRDQLLVVDGHNLKSIARPEIPRLLSNDIPLLFRNREIIPWDAMRNSVGESDHTVFHYIHHFMSSPHTNEIYRSYRIMSNDTDLLLLSICMLERRDLAVEWSEHRSTDKEGKKLAPFDIVLQIPNSKTEKKPYLFYFIHVNRLIEYIRKTNPKFAKIERPVQNLAFSMYLKSHDYDDSRDYSVKFLNRIGHKKIWQTMTNYATEIGSLIHWDAQGRFHQIKGEAIRKLVCATYFVHYDTIKSEKARLYPFGTSLASITFDALTQQVANKNLGKSEEYRLQIPPNVDILKKAMRLNFLIALFDDAIHGCAGTEERSISENDLIYCGYDEMQIT